MGGGHAIGLAARHPERVRGLVLVDHSPQPMPEGATRARRLTSTRDDRFDDRAAALAYLKRTSPGYSDHVYEGRLEHAFRATDGGGLVWRSDRDALARIFQHGLPAAERWAELERVRCPTLVVRGTRSQVLDERTARRMVDATHGRLLELDAGHNIALDRPHELASAIVELAGSL